MKVMTYDSLRTKKTGYTSSCLITAFSIGRFLASVRDWAYGLTMD